MAILYQIETKKQGCIMSKKYILLLSVLSALLFHGCSDSKKEGGNTSASANQMIATTDFKLKGLDDKEYLVKKSGQNFTLDGAENKIVIFDIFATWCPPCRAAAKHLSSLQEKYKENLIVIGITIEDKVANEKLKEFASTYKANYVLVNSEQNRRLSDAIVKELNLGERYPIPTMAMYKNGQLINHYVGATEEEFIERDIKNALGK